MENSYLDVSDLSISFSYRYTYLLDGHNNLNGVQTIETKVVGEVGLGRKLCKVRYCVYDLCILLYIYLACIGDLAQC